MTTMNWTKQIMALLLIAAAFSGAGLTLCGARGETNPARSDDEVRRSARGLLQEAAEALLAAQGPSTISNSRGMLEVAVLQALAGDAESALKSFAQARDLIKALPGNQSGEWRMLARSYAQAGELAQVRTAVDALPDPGRNYGGSLEAFRNIVLSECATTLARAGKSKEALELAKLSTGGQWSVTNSRLLHEVALHHARARDWNGARRTLDQIPEADLKIQTLAGVIHATRQRAPQTIDLPGEPGIALIQDEAGDHEGARQSLRLALEIASGIKETRAQAHERATIACVQARLGDLAAARKTMEQIPADSDMRGLAQVAIVRAQAASGQRQEALRVADKLNTMSLRVYGLSQVIMGQAQAGDVKDAPDTGVRALGLIRNLPEQEQLSALVILCTARAAAKDVQGALETAAQMKYGNSSFGYTNIAYMQARAGNMRDALITLKDNLRKDWTYHRMLQALARLQADRGEDKEALLWARELIASEERGYALVGVAEGMLQRHRIGIDRR